MKRLTAILLLGVFACDPASTLRGSSSDVPTTESSPPYPEWAIGSAPVVRIGAVDGPPESVFTSVVFAGRLSDGRFVVVDDGSHELRWFDSEGRFELRAGGRGEGPGEFSSIVAAALTPGDSVVLYDSRNQRLTWFGPDGAVGRALRVELNAATSLIPLRDGRVVLAEERPTLNLGGAEYNHSRDSVLIVITGSTYRPLDTVMHRAGREAATWVAYTDGRPIGTQQLGLPFGHATLVGAVAEQIVLAEGGRAELAFFDEEGEAVRVARRTDVHPRPLSAALREEYVRNTVRSARERGVPEPVALASAEALLGMVPEGRNVSPFDRMLTDPVSGRIWVRDYVLDWNAGSPQHWTIHDSMGQVLGRVETPTGGSRSCRWVRSSWSAWSGTSWGSSTLSCIRWSGPSDPRARPLRCFSVTSRKLAARPHGPQPTERSAQA